VAKKRHDLQPPVETVPPKPRPLLARLVLNTRVLGLIFFALGLYGIETDRPVIARTGHGTRKSAVLPSIALVGLALLIDPDCRRPAILATCLILGCLGDVVWFVLWG
jgi:hypothetical protein